MRQLDHPNIVKLIDFSEARQYYYIVLELCPGGELFHQIVRLTYFSEDLSRHVITQVAKALRYLHEECGVVHRYVECRFVWYHGLLTSSAVISNQKISFSTPFPLFPHETQNQKARMMRIKPMKASSSPVSVLAALDRSRLPILAFPKSSGTRRL